MSAPLPANEELRLHALLAAEILDTSPEPDYDELARLAAAICGTPIALVSLLDDKRQWFKACVGLDATETPRDVAFCAHAILGTEVFEVKDTHADPRFADNPFVTGAPYVRFYAGAPLINEQGFPLGTLCVIDHVPRALTEQQTTALRILAKQVVRQIDRTQQVLEKRRAFERAKQAETRLRGLMTAQLCGIVFFRLSGEVVEANDTFLQITGYTREDFVSGAIDWVELTPPEHRAGNRRAANELSAQGSASPWEKEYRRKDGTRVPVLATSVRFGQTSDEGVLFVIDMTQQKQAETTLRKSEGHLRSLFEATPIGAAFGSIDGRWERANPALCRLLGYTEQELLGRPFANVTHPDDRAVDAPLMRDLADGIIPIYQREKRYVRKDGTTFWAWVVVSMIRDDAGVAVRFAAQIQDVTARRRAEQALIETNALRRAILDAANYTIISTTPDGVVREFNPTASRLLGYEASQVVGKVTLSAFHDPDEMTRRSVQLSRELRTHVSGFETFVAKARSGGADENEWTYVTREGRRFPVLLSVTALRDAKETLLGFLAVGSDITERKRTEHQLRLSEARIRAITETAHDAIIAADGEGIIRYINPAAEETFGRSRDTLVGQHLATLMPERFRGDLGAVVSRFLATGQSRTIGRTHELVGLRGDGSEFPIEISLAGWRLDGEASFTGIGRDISARKRAEAELVRAKEAAEEATRAKSDFLARMSHEIRSPMNGVLGMTELALRTALTSEQREYLDTAKSSAESLLRIIDDILDFSKIEAGKLAFENQRFELRECVGSTLRGLGSQASRKSLELVLAVDPRVPEEVVGDSHRLRQVLTNLVSNAIKFTDRGDIIVELREIERSATHSTIEFRVTDSGIGVPTEKLATIFDEFSQAEESITRRFGGTGLGLAICSQLVRLMGGTIGVDSAVGKGSSFHFAVKFEAFRAQRDPLEWTEFVGVPALVAIEHPVLSRVVTEMLTAWEMTPLVATSASEAIAIAKERASALRILIIDDEFSDASAVQGEIDRAVPDQLWRIVLEKSSLARATPSEEPRVHVLSKPVTASILFDAIASIVTSSGRGSGVHTSVRPLATPARPLKILLAEDNAINQRVAVGVLQAVGHRVEVVENGRSALEAIAIHPYDVVLMDVQMPEMDGLDATRAVRAIEAREGGHVPIVALTAQALRGDAERCLLAGADAYLSKPFNPDALLKTIEQVTARLAFRVPPLEISRASHLLVEKGGKMSEEQAPYDPAVLLSHAGGDLALAREVAAVFLADEESTVKDLERELEKGDREGIRRVVHRLRGAVLAVGGKRAGVVAGSLEDGARTRDLDVMRKDVAELVRELKGLGERIGAWLKKGASN